MPSPFASLASVISLRPFNTATLEGRSKERYRRLALTGITSIGLRLSAGAISLLSVPLTLHHLGQERYGLWMTISSTAALFSFADLGLGNGLLNSVTEANGAGDKQKVCELVSSTFLLLTTVALSGLALFSLVYPLVDWSRVFNVTSSAAITEAGPAIGVFTLFFFAALPFSIVQRVQAAFQEGGASNIWQIGGTLVGFVGLLLVVALHASTPWLVAAVSGSTALTVVLNCFIHFTVVRPWLRPRLQHIRRATLTAVSASGSVFFILQLLLIAGTASDPLIIAHTLGPRDVATYSVVQRLFSVTAIAYYFITPLWPAIGEALTAHDYRWIRRATARALIFGVAVTLPTVIVLNLFGLQLIRCWTRSDIHPSPHLLLAGGVYCLFNVGVGTASVLLNQPPLLNRHVKYYAAASLAAPLAKLHLVHRMGAAGVFWGAIFAYGLLWGLPALLLIRRLLRGEVTGAQQQPATARP